MKKMIKDVASGKTIQLGPTDASVRPLIGGLEERLTDVGFSLVG